MSAVVAGADETPCNHCCFPLCPATTKGAIQNSKITFTKSCLSSSFLLLPRSSLFCCRLFCLHWADPQTCWTVQHSCSSLSLSLSLSHTHTQQILGNSKHTTACFPTASSCLQRISQTRSGLEASSIVWSWRWHWTALGLPAGLPNTMVRGLPVL